MLYENIEIFDAKDRDMLIKSNLSDAQELIYRGETKEAIDKINAIKDFMIKTSELIIPAK